MKKNTRLEYELMMTRIADICACAWACVNKHVYVNN